VSGRDDAAAVAAEQRRILAEYRRREREVGDERYAPWNPAAIFLREGRTRAAALALTRAGRFPRAGDPCLEVGHGSLGWLAELLAWGLREEDLHGLELDPERASRARAAFPAADLRVGDAAAMPWPDARFALVIASTVFSSILDASVRTLVAREIERVLRPGGALLWYDLRMDNPKNENVRGLGSAAIRSLFPGLAGRSRTVTLAPPLARALAPRARLAASALEAIPMLRTHRLGVFVKGVPS
jgi:SAM-dependent methyltransferase